MQEYWELYMKNVDGKPASILFNAGISMEIEELKYSYPTIAFVKVQLQEPNDTGLLSENEEAEILFMEDKLEASLIKFRIGKYVGRVISDGSVTFLYYLQYTYNWPDFLTYALDEFTSYEVTNGHQDDSEWKYYQQLLYPTAKEWQIIQNHKACDQLKASGDNLHLARAIEHKLFYTNEYKKEKLLEDLIGQGFKIKDELLNDEGVKGVSFYRTDKPFYYEIDKVTLHLVELLETYDAQYDGWETSVVKSSL
jgi:regulator of RNase E activity RraB